MLIKVNCSEWRNSYIYGNTMKSNTMLRQTMATKKGKPNSFGLGLLAGDDRCIAGFPTPCNEGSIPSISTTQR